MSGNGMVVDTQMVFALRKMASDLKRTSKALNETRDNLARVGIQNSDLDGSAARLDATVLNTEATAQMILDFQRGRITLQELEAYRDTYTAVAGPSGSVD